MKRFTSTDTSRIIAALSDSRTTVEEHGFLAEMLGLAAANEAVSDREYTRTSTLVGINMHVEDSIFDRSTSCSSHKATGS
jgi:lactam utilization protein B